MFRHPSPEPKNHAELPLTTKYELKLSYVAEKQVLQISLSLVNLRDESITWTKQLNNEWTKIREIIKNYKKINAPEIWHNTVMGSNRRGDDDTYYNIREGIGHKGHTLKLLEELRKNNLITLEMIVEFNSKGECSTIKNLVAEKKNEELVEQKSQSQMKTL